MSDSLRDRIAKVLQPRLLSIMRFPDAWIATANANTMAHAVIEALPELTQPVSVEPIGDYQYVCHPCGSSFSFYSSSTMQQFALMHSGSHNPKDAHD